MTKTENKGRALKNNDKGEKKKFNVRKWREQKYSTKAKVQRWDEIKRRQAFRQYNKELKKSSVNNTTVSNIKHNEIKPRGLVKEAEQRYRQIQQEKQEKRKEWERIQKERNEAIKAYKEKKAMRYRKLCQKTRKGQPLMRGRIELLLEKIQKEYGNNSINNDNNNRLNK